MFQRLIAAGLVAALLFLASPYTADGRSDWDEDGEPYRKIEDRVEKDVGPPVIESEPEFSSGGAGSAEEFSRISGDGDSDQQATGDAPGMSASGQTGAPQPNPPDPGATSLGSPAWLKTYTEKVKSGAKAVAGTPKQIMTGSGHLLHDPRFWTVTAGGAALGAAGVGTYFLLKNANKQQSKPQPVYIINDGQMIPAGTTANYPYGFQNGQPIGVPANYPYSGYSNYPGTVFPGAHLVNTYITKDGVVVKSHMRTNPNDTMRDNMSSYGNINPFTGKPGWIIPRY